MDWDRMADEGGEGYAVQILLPEALQMQFREWVALTPGATWPAWGGHVTLVPRFVPVDGIEVVHRVLKDVCSRFPPFVLKLDRVIAAANWRRPHLQSLFLIPSDTRHPGYRTVMRLQEALVKALEPHKRDQHPEVSKHPFQPHITLTLGLSEREAADLLRAAINARLAVEFHVDEIWLLQYSVVRQTDAPTGEREIVSGSRSFVLAGSP